MLPVYEEYFAEQLIQARLVSSFNKSWVGEIYKLVPSHWRPDAAYFLVSNVYSMVVHPYMRANHKRRLADTDAWQLIRVDVDMLVKGAENIALERRRDYVSATSVAVALGRLAPELRTTGLQIWGPREIDEQVDLA